MTAHRTATGKIREQASLLAAGALPPAEETAFLAHAQTCGVCAAELQSFRETAAAMPFASPAFPAPSGLREKLMARVLQPTPPQGIQVVRAGDGDWLTVVPGVTAKRLHQESPGGNVVLLVRMEPGAQYPPHTHADVEHCYVLEGELHFGDLILRPGDFQCALPSTTHRDSHTVNGCKVLIVASQKNSLLPWTR